jgi:hypothetical protein
MVGEVELALESIKILSQVASKVMDMLPNYEQSKRNTYYNLLKSYQDEKGRDYPLKDDNKLIMYRNDLLRFLDVFSKELDVYIKEVSSEKTSS